MITNNGKGRERDRDPAPTHTDVPRERVEQWLHNISTLSTEQLRHLRDHIDNLMRSIQAEEEQISKHLQRHSEFCQSVLDFKSIVSDGIAKISPVMIEGRVEPPPPPPFTAAPLAAPKIPAAPTIPLRGAPAHAPTQSLPIVEDRPRTAS
jgi:hypothetical protein